MMDSPFCAIFENINILLSFHEVIYIDFEGYDLKRIALNISEAHLISDNMGMKEIQFRGLAKGYLHELGFEVHDIEAKGSNLAPDLDVIGKNSRYTIELKIKGDDPDEILEEEKALLSGELISKSIPIGPRNRLAGIIKKGIKQIISHDPRHDTYHIIWVHCSGDDPEFLYERFFSTLYGKETLFSLSKENITTCYYFHDSAFYAWRDYLDGVILTYLDKAQLCINTLSLNAERFRHSELTRGMYPGHCDPDVIEKECADVMIADCRIDRSKQDDVLRYLKSKYDVDHLQTIPTQKHTGMKAFPFNREE